MRISQPSQNPSDVREKFLVCPYCNGIAHVRFPYLSTYEQKMKMTHDAIEAHRRACAKAPSDEGRVTKIHYPR